MLCLAVVAVVAVDGGGVCAPTPQKFFLTAIAVICKFVGNQSEFICEMLPTLFSRDRGEYKIYSKRCFSDQSDCKTDFCKLLYNYLPNQ